MSLFKKFQRMLNAKLSPQDPLELLAQSLNETGDELLRYDGVHGRTVQRYVRSAEDACKLAFKALKHDNEDEAVAKTKTGLVHLHIAKLLLNGKEQQTKLEVQSGIDTIEGALNHLIHQIAKVKLIVEYGDLQVTPAIQESLVTVMKIFDAAVTDMRKRHVGDAKREAGAAMVALHWTVCQLEAANPNQPFSELKMPKEGALQAELKACELASKIVECKTALTEMQALAIPEVIGQLESAEEKFSACLENLIDGDRESTTLESRAGLLDLQSAMRLAQEAVNTENNFKAQAYTRTIGQFKQDAHRILRLTEQLDIDNDSLERRMEAAEKYFINAHRQLQNGDLVEAERLARAAHLDLDFCWQIANAISKAEYRLEL